MSDHLCAHSQRVRGLQGKSFRNSAGLREADGVKGAHLPAISYETLRTFLIFSMPQFHLKMEKAP